MNLQFLFPILIFIGLTGNSHESLLSRLKQIHHAVHLIKSVINPNSTLAELEPLAKGLTFEHVKECYNASIGTEDVDIFKVTIEVVARKFIEFNYHLIIVKNHAEMLKRIRNLLHNIRLLARRIIKCALNTDPNFKPTRIGLNSFSVYSFSEIKAKFTMPMDLPPMGSIRKHSYSGPCFKTLSPEYIASLPEKFDWRDKGIVTPVKNQGDCASCYAFSAVGALEAAYQIQVNGSKKVQFSEQDFINCYSNDGQNGCGMGYPHEVLDMAVKRGLMLLENREYHAKPDQCVDPNPIFARPAHFCLQKKLTDDMFKAIVYKFGPSIIGFNADNPDFFDLKGSPFNRKCPENKADHAMLLIGWDSENWIIKNSYGSSWGIDGYLVVPRDNARECGMMDFAGVPEFAKANGSGSEKKPETGGRSWFSGLSSWFG